MFSGPQPADETETLANSSRVAGSDLREGPATREFGGSLSGRSSEQPPKLFREWEFALLALVVVAIYFSRLTDLSLRGEESRRGLVALEMIWSGDWIVPRQQADAGFMSSRPPLQNWLIAAFGLLLGRVDALAIRLPSVIALLLVASLLYWYARQFMSRFGAFAAGAVYVTLLHVMELGRLGETDQVLTLFVSSSLLLWHGGLSRGWHPARIWTIAYLCAAFATMTKGLQGTVYFVGPVAVYLVATRQWRFALARWHAVGIGLYALVLGAWQIPFAREVGLEGLRHTFVGDVTTYTRDRRWSVFAEHLVSFPAEIVLGCLLPWSIYLFTYLRKDFRARLGTARTPVLFLATALLVTFPTVWFVPLSLTRFYASMYPCLALLIGIAMQRCLEAGADAWCGKMWKYLTTAAALAIAAGGVLIPGIVRLDPSGDQFGQPAWFVAAFSLACFPLAWVMWKSRAPFHNSPLPLHGGVFGSGGAAGDGAARREVLRNANSLAASTHAHPPIPSPSPARGQGSRFVLWRGLLSFVNTTDVRAVAAVASTALFLGMCSTGLYINHRIVTTPATSESMSRVLERLPPGSTLVSFGTIPHLFNLHYAAPIRAIPLPATAADVPADLDYFCFTALWQKYPELPFPWEELGTVVCDRFIQPTPELFVVVARRIDSPSASPNQPLPQIASGDPQSTPGLPGRIRQ